MLKKILTLVLTVACHACFAQSGPPPAEGPDRGYIVKVGQQAPDDFVLKLTDGTTTSLKALRGKVVVLQLTASYCTVCRLKFPHLEHELWLPLKSKNFMLIAVDWDEPLAKAVKFKKDIQITYPMALDAGAVIFGKFAFKQAGISRDIVIDQNGRIVFLTRLFDQKEFEEMTLKVKSLLSKS